MSVQNQVEYFDSTWIEFLADQAVQGDDRGTKINNVSV